MNFKIGDSVQLKSGGPVMTVYFVDGDSIGCVWFIHSTAESPSRFTFPAGALQAAT